MKKLIMIMSVCVMALAFNVKAAETNSTSLFNSGEFGLSLGSGYVVDKAEAFKTPYSVNVQAGAFWFPWKHFGFDVEVPFYSTAGVSVQEVQAGVVARLPLSDHIVVLKNLSPYVGVDAVYNWQTGQNWAYVGKVGLDVRLNKKWGIFTEGQFRNTDFNFDNGQRTIVSGLKFAF
jgi:hypothetical protein